MVRQRKWCCADALTLNHACDVAKILVLEAPAAAAFGRNADRRKVPPGIRRRQMVRFASARSRGVAPRYQRGRDGSEIRARKPDSGHGARRRLWLCGRLRSFT